MHSDSKQDAMVLLLWSCLEVYRVNSRRRSWRMRKDRYIARTLHSQLTFSGRLCFHVLNTTRTQYSVIKSAVLLPGCALALFGFK